MEKSTLTRKRASIKSKLTIFKNYVTTIENETDFSDNMLFELQERVNRIQDVLDEFDNVQMQIEEIEESSEEQINERETFESIFFRMIAIAKRILSEHSSTNNTENLNTDQGAGSVTSENNQTQYAGVKLPTIQLPKFEGNIENWLEYRDTFESLIHTNSSINCIQKFHYLRASLSGEASQIVRSLEFTAANYGTAWSTLCDRYNNINLLLNNHVKALFNIEQLSKESSIGLRKIIDHISKHLRALKTLEQPTEYWDTLIIYLITAKLDKSSIREWEMQKSNDLPTLEELKTFLKKRADLLETIESSKIDRQRLSKNNESRSLVAVNSNVRCLFCQRDHFITNCSEFLKFNTGQRIENIKRLKACLNCLRRGHYNKNCKWGSCKKCKGKHHTLLHHDLSDEMPVKNEENADVSTSVKAASGSEVVSLSSHHLTQNSQIVLSTALIQVRDKNNKTRVARVLLDAGSQSSFVTKSFAELLELPTKKVNVMVGGFGQSMSNIDHSCQIEIFSNHSNFRMKLHCLVTPQITGELPNITLPDIIKNIPKNIQLADPTFCTPSGVDILLGAECFWNLLCIGQIKLDSGLILQKTKLGWIIGGQIQLSSRSSRVSCHFTQKLSTENILKRFWEIEECPSTKIFSSEETACEKHFVENTTRDVSGRFIVSIPLKEDISVLGDSYHTALKRFLSNEKRLLKDEKLRDNYCQFMSEYKQLGHMRKVTDDNSGQVSYYMPHHGILREDSTTTKLRVVFDASAASSSGVSFNKLQMTGPTIQQELFSILVRFRKHRYVICSDIEKMYRQILIKPNERRLQRILWRFDPQNQIDTYELQTVTYGTTAASFLAIRCLYQLGLECETEYPDIAEIIKSDFYVDDLITGSDTLKGAVHIVQKVSEVLEKGCLNLRKWKSNHQDIIANFKRDESSTLSKIGCDENTKTLGLYWHSESDELTYKVSEINFTKVTKRAILSDTAQIFDPLGLLGPCIITAKIILQKLWLLGLSWDQSVPHDLHVQWLEYRNTLPMLSNIRIKRHALCSDPTEIQIHGFSDASECAYGACVYLRSRNAKGDVNVNLLCAKSRVAPIKSLTVPRLELCGALILSKLIEKVMDALRVENIKVFLWTDSTIVLGWLGTSPHLLQIFVANRVVQINTVTEKIDASWHHVPTKDNPADCLSRGLNPSNLTKSKLWWNGPEWLLYVKEFWPSGSVISKDLPEMRKSAKLNVIETWKNFRSNPIHR